MKRSIKIFLLFSRFSMKSTFQARFGVILFIAGKLVRFAFLLALIFIIFGRIKIVRGYSLDQMIVFFLTYNLIDSLSQILFREVYRFRSLVVNGGLDQVLLKPYHPFLRVLVGGIDFLDIIVFFPYMAITAWYILQIKSVTWESTLAYFALIINAFIITAAFHIFALSVGILTTEVDHTMMIYRDLTSMGRFPIDIYKEPVKTIFTFVIPIGVMMSFPSQALFRILSPGFIPFSFVLSLVLLSTSILVWNRALQQYQSWGG